jgi:hypothetical protein
MCGVSIFNYFTSAMRIEPAPPFTSAPKEGRAIWDTIVSTFTG